MIKLRKILGYILISPMIIATEIMFCFTGVIFFLPVFLFFSLCEYLIKGTFCKDIFKDFFIETPKDIFNTLIGRDGF